MLSWISEIERKTENKSEKEIQGFNGVVSLGFISLFCLGILYVRATWTSWFYKHFAFLVEQTLFFLAPMNPRSLHLSSFICKLKKKKKMDLKSRGRKRFSCEEHF